MIALRHAIYLLSFLPFENESANDPEASRNSGNTHTHTAAIHSFIRLKARMCRKYSACTWGCICTVLLVELSAGSMTAKQAARAQHLEHLSGGEKKTNST